ncbi:MAG: histidine phosphatase family protein [Rubrivivax sp.]
MSRPVPLRERRLLLARHGATAPNLAGLRCGGDIDPPLAAEGREQALRLAQRLAALAEPPQLIITSDLRRTGETAEIVRRELGLGEVHVDCGFRERKLGAWNLRPIAETENAMLAGATPPGGESRAEFAARVEAALVRVAPLTARRAILVASRGVARVLRERCGTRGAPTLGNGELVELRLTLPSSAVVASSIA